MLSAAILSAPTVSGVMGDVGTVLESLTSQAGTVITFITTHPLVYVPCLLSLTMWAFMAVSKSVKGN